uniref:Uncharacterized protein n=1 Tax=Panagrolaimus sp. PS1159 TaxID=55785 RepID=A0AC35FVM8_9BILA
LVATVDFTRYVLFLIWFPLTVLQLFVHLFAEHSGDIILEDTSPESTAAFLNRQFVCWFNRIVSTGYRKSLETFDLYRLELPMTGQPLFHEWHEIYRPRAEKYYEKFREAKIKTAFDASYGDPLLISDSTPLLGDEKGILRTQALRDKSVIEGYGSTSDFRKAETEAKKDIPIKNAPIPPSIVSVLFSIYFTIC